MFKKYSLPLLVMLFGLTLSIQVVSANNMYQVKDIPENFNMLFLANDLNNDLQQEIDSELQNLYGSHLITWGTDTNFLQYGFTAYAYPSDIRGEQFHQRLVNDFFTSTSNCVYLYDYYNYWGSKVTFCGISGNTYKFILEDFDFSNRASSYKENSSTSYIRAYDSGYKTWQGNYWVVTCLDWLVTLDANKSVFGWSYNNKISCVEVHH